MTTYSLEALSQAKASSLWVLQNFDSFAIVSLGRIWELQEFRIVGVPCYHLKVASKFIFCAGIISSHICAYKQTLSSLTYHTKPDQAPALLMPKELQRATDELDT